MAVKDIYYADYKKWQFFKYETYKVIIDYLCQYTAYIWQFDRLRKRQNFFYQVIKLISLSKMNSSIKSRLEYKNTQNFFDT